MSLMRDTVAPLPTSPEMPSRTYRYTVERIAGYADDLEARVQALKHIFGTERGAYQIYSSSYGIDLEQYIGASFSYVQATIERTMREAVLADDRFVSLTVTSIRQTEIDAVEIIVDIETDLGMIYDFALEVRTRA